jgi:hypothetical protein
MRHRRQTGAALAIGVVLCWAFGAVQTVGEAQTGAMAIAPPAESPRAAVIMATEVLRIADVIAQSLARTSRIPGPLAVTLSDGRGQSLSPAQAFALLTRFLGNGYEAGLTPEYAPLPPAMTAPLEYGPGGSGAAPTATALTTTVATSTLLSQARATADVAESTGHLPSAVWVVGQRLSPAQFMGALATVLQHTLYHGQIPDQVRIGAWLPPLDWAEAGPTPTPNVGPLGATVPTGVAPVGVGPPAPGAEAPAREEAALAPAASSSGAFGTATAGGAPALRPFIRLWLPTEGQLSGVASLTIEYDGPTAFTRVAIDGKAKAVSNMRHFDYSWDTRLESDGSHSVQVTAVNASNETLAAIEATVETANGNKPLR